MSYDGRFHFFGEVCDGIGVDEGQILVVRRFAKMGAIAEGDNPLWAGHGFEGRQGRGGRTHLVSPAMAAAVAGRFTDIRELN